MKKRHIIVWSIVAGVILSLCIICTMVFRLGKIDFQLTALLSIPERSRLFTDSQTKQDVETNMLESAKFEQGGNILFMNFDAQIENIEKANPFVKVEKIVRRFPNKAVVYYSEREATALIPMANVENGYFVVDTDLKILDSVTEDDDKFLNNNQDKYVLPILDYFDYSINSLEKGDFIDNESLKTHLNTFVSGAFSANNESSALYEDIMGWATDIEFFIEENEDNRCKYILKSNSNAEIVFTIYNINERLFDKVSSSWSVFIRVYREAVNVDKVNLQVYIGNSDNKIKIVDSQGEIVNSDQNIA